MNSDLVQADWPFHALRFQHFAMNTIFEIFMVHDQESFASGAAHEAFLLLDHLENDLSRFKENSDVARINQLQPGESTVVSPHTFECLQRAKEMFQWSEGMFDVGAGDVFDFYKGKKAAPQVIHSGSVKNLELQAKDWSVICRDAPVSVDLGGIGKGFALEQMKALLLDWEIESALLHGGHSSVLCFGPLAWPLSLHNPFTNERPVQRLLLQNQALGASGLAKGRHIVNPKTGQPLQEPRAAWVLAPDATLADALSTVCLLRPPQKVVAFFHTHPELAFYLATEQTVYHSPNWPQNIPAA